MHVLQLYDHICQSQLYFLRCQVPAQRDLSTNAGVEWWQGCWFQRCITCPLSQAQAWQLCSQQSFPPAADIQQLPLVRFKPLLNVSNHALHGVLAVLALLLRLCSNESCTAIATPTLPLSHCTLQLAPNEDEVRSRNRPLTHAMAALQLCHCKPLTCILHWTVSTNSLLHSYPPWLLILGSCGPNTEQPTARRQVTLSVCIECEVIRLTCL